MSSPDITKEGPRLEVRFYANKSGNEPVRQWLKGMNDEVRYVIGMDLLKVQWKWPIGKPLIDGFGNGLFEVRSNVRGIMYRIFFTIKNRKMILLHGINKKTQKTPLDDIALARARKKEVKESNE